MFRDYRVRIDAFYLGFLVLLLLSIGSVLAQGIGGDVYGALILTVESVRPSGKLVHLYTYALGNITETWSIRLDSGGEHSVSLNDANDDGKPELVFMDESSLLVFENVSGGYELVINKSGRTHVVRVHVMDYHTNETEYLLCLLTGASYLVDYDAGEYMLSKQLPPYSSGKGFDVGDVNNDGLADIVAGNRVWENEGGGKYHWVELGNQLDTPHITEIRIGDVTGDGINEIVMVGYSFHGRPNFCVWKNIGGDYFNIWKHLGESISAVDIGDLDGDGMNEIVTGSEQSERGVSIWKFQPEIVYEGRVLESRNYFYRLWEEKKHGVDILDLCLRVSVIDGSGQEKIVAVGREMEEQNFFLYIVEKGEVGYDSRIIPLWENARAICPTMDVWAIMNVAQFAPWMMIVLTASVVGIINSRKQSNLHSRSMIQLSWDHQVV